MPPDCAVAMNCPVCQIDIADWDIDARSSHVNSCIDQPHAPGPRPPDQQPILIDLDEGEGEKPSYNFVNKFTCPLCGNLFFSLTSHLMKCGPKHDVPPPDLVALIEAAKIAAKHSSIPKKTVAPKTRKTRQKKSTDETKPTRRRRKKDADPQEQDAEPQEQVASATAKDDVTSNGQASDSVAKCSKGSKGLKSKYLSTKCQDQSKTTPISVRNGRLVAMKSLFTCDEVEARVNKIFSGTIPCNHMSSQSSRCSQESSKSTASLCKAFEAANFLTEQSFTANGFSKYVSHDQEQTSDKK